MSRRLLDSDDEYRAMTAGFSLKEVLNQSLRSKRGGSAVLPSAAKAAC